MNLLNKRFKIGTLISESGCSKETAKDWETFYSIFKERDPDSFKNGRMNYGWIQTMVCDLSNGLFLKGGQGRADPDFWYNVEKWGETKAYQLGSLQDVDVAASAFFAKNSKVPEHRRLLAEDYRKAKSFLFKHSYDKNDYYLLTSTRGLDCEFSELEMIFVEKQILVDCLTASSNFKQVSMAKLLSKVTNV
jgi:hypothetical protein